MTDEQAAKIISLLQEIKDLGVAANDMAAKNLELTQIVFSRTDAAYERTARLQDRAETFQDRSLKIAKWLLYIIFLCILLFVLLQLFR